MHHLRTFVRWVNWELLGITFVIACTFVGIGLPVYFMVQDDNERKHHRYTIHVPAGKYEYTYPTDAIQQLPDGGLVFQCAGRRIEVHGAYSVEDRGK